MTFSIVARCKKTGMLGMAVSTARPAVGSLAVYVKAGVGAIASQAALNPYFGINGLKYLEQGMSAEEVMEKVKSEDAEFERRQLAIVDNEGRTAGYTGTDTVPWDGHYFGDQFVVAGNMLVGEEVVQEILAVKIDRNDQSGTSSWWRQTWSTVSSSKSIRQTAISNRRFTGR